MRKLFASLKVEKSDYSLLETICFSFFTSGFMSIMLGAVLPHMKSEHSLSYAQSGLMLSGHQLGNLLSVLVAGALPYIVGRKNSTLIMFAGTSLGTLLMTLTGNPLFLMAAFTLTGIGRGTLSNICNVVASDVSGNKTGALNMLHAVFAVGALLSPPAVLLASKSIGWRYAAFLSLALSVSAWVLIYRSNLSSIPETRQSEGSLSFLKKTSFWLKTMILFFYICAEASIIGWFVLYFESAGILPAAVSQLTPTLLWSMIMSGRLLCAYISGKTDKSKLLLTLGVLFTLSFTGMLSSRSAVPCVLFLLGTGLSMAGIYPTIVSMTKGGVSTVETGFFISIASLGGILMPGIVGAVADARGLAGGVATLLAALAAMLALMIINFVREKYRRAGRLSPQ